ncbi:magnesium transporter [soil metagenome]
MPGSKIKIIELVSKIESLIAGHKWKKLQKELQKHHTAVIVDLFQELEPAQEVVIFRLLPRERASQLFRRLDPQHEEALLRNLSRAETIKLLEALKPDERVNLIEEMPDKVTRRLLNMLEPEDRAEAVHLLGYPEDSVGRLMTPDFVAVKAEWTVAQTLAHMRKRAKESETINVVYVVDATWHLLGYAELNKIILAKEDTLISTIMDERITSLSAYDDRERAVTTMNRNKVYVIPVVDSKNALLGIVTFDDVVEVAQEEATEDFHKSSAIAPLDTSYAQASIARLFQRRIGWLVALVVINLASSGVIAAYEETLASAIALAFFIPLLIDSGGNAGAQSATLMIRAISVGEVRLSNWLRTVSKEMAVGISLAVALGVAGAVVGLIRGGAIIGLIVGLSMAIIIVITNLLGSVLPFVLMRLKVDPAVASGPLITSVADVMGLLIYFTIATSILGQVT